MRTHRTIAGLGAAALLLVACSGSDSTDELVAATTTSAPAGAEVGGAAGIEDLDEYFAEADRIPAADSDAGIPPGEASAVGGAPGFSRYVFRGYEDQVLASLVEGPNGKQTRCQDPALPCSYLELKALHESGDPIPDELGMTPDELEELVGQLDTLNGKMDEYADVEKACADGYRSDRTQTPNMGSHFYNLGYIAEGVVDPEKPHILLYGRAGGEDPGGPLGQCVDGVWEGGDVEILGTSWILTQTQVGDDHPEGFAGPLDNWHIHYNLCRGLGTDSIVPRDVCVDNGGRFNQTLGWMLHAWVDDDFDNDLGVFSMWNPTIWPVADAEAIAGRFQVKPEDLPEGAEYSAITNFDFGGEIHIDEGGSVVFGNSDAVPHTVTAGNGAPTGAFDTGVFGPGSNIELTFDEAGEFSFFCVLHPDMTGTIVVE